MEMLDSDFDGLIDVKELTRALQHAGLELRSLKLQQGRSDTEYATAIELALPDSLQEITARAALVAIYELLELNKLRTIDFIRLIDRRNSDAHLTPAELKKGAVEIAQVVTKTYVKNVEVRGLPRDRQNSEPNSQDFGNTKPFGTVLSYLTFGVYGILPPAKDVYVKWNGDPTTWGDYLRKAKVHYPLNRLEVNLLDNDQGDLESQRRPGGLMLMRKSQKADEQFSQRLPLLLEENKEIYRKAQLSLILAQNFPDSRRTSRMKPTKETMMIGDGRDPGGVVANINGALISGVAVVMILIQKIQMTTMIPTYHGTS
ncbi:unnamed protein product [Effrenium voratum]|uniref:EF-hand domain-containing protein n=1 Tax=Effrenium voratum TaxID=2562239 RepID=A0AA36IGK5_9DINO|nr:unnamed protein product [Effrenium voratum]